MDLRARVIELVERSGISPRRMLGQSFVVDEFLLARLIKYAEILPSETVLEIGTGFGFLTEMLSRVAHQVYTIELDRRLCQIARELLRGRKNVRLIEGDALEVSFPEFDKVVSNPPYTISSDLVFRLLRHTFRSGVLTFQTEFAKRLAAPSGTPEYGRLTVMFYQKAEVELLEEVPRKSFYPAPRVDSTVVRIRLRKPPFELKDAHMFEEVVRFMFTQRRRISKRVVERFVSQRCLPRAALDEVFKLPQVERRVYELSPEDFAAVSNALS
jgi:16S rRNA (adenine1518-N6/adenine1519-N6)-dimethyltransferase